MAQKLGLRRRFRAILVLCCGPIKAWGGGSSAWATRVATPREERHAGPAAPALADIIDLGHALVRLAWEIDWGVLDRRFAGVRPPGAGSSVSRRGGWRGGSFSSTCTTCRTRFVRARRENPVLPVLLRRIELLPPAAVRPLVIDPLAPAAG